MLQVSDLKVRCADLSALKDEQQQLSTQQAECERLAALNSELRLRAVDLAALQQEHDRLTPVAEEAQQLKQQLQEMEEDVAELPDVKVGVLRHCVALRALCLSRLVERGGAFHFPHLVNNQQAQAVQS